jgi:thymidine phosphorylase
LLLLGGLADSQKSARFMLCKVIETGMAAESFARMVSMQGGPADLIEQPAKYLSSAPVVRALAATNDGGIEFMDTRAIGLAIVTLGGGRNLEDDIIDHRVGLSDFCLVGDTVSKGDPLATIHAADEESWQIAAQALSEAIVIGRTMDALPAVYERFP